MKKIAYVTLGCARNTVDSEKMLMRLRRKGYPIADISHADIVVINTCGFIDPAKEESIETIRDALDLKAEGKLEKVIVCGCLAKRYYKDLFEHLDGVDAYMGVINLEDSDRVSLTLPHLANLKIAEGCQNKCSYCAIPLIRGPLTSRKEADILEEVKFLNKQGIQELTVAAQDTTAYAKDLDPNTDYSIAECDRLIELLKKIVNEANSIPWIRLMYAHPRFTNTKLIDYIANEPKICNYLDLPIQHINDRILNSMNRHTDSSHIKSILDYTRKNYPDFAIRSTLITGFPTETEAEFEEVLTFIEEYRLRNLGAFVYSKEDDTPAYDMEQIIESVKQERHEQIMFAQQDVSYELNQECIGMEFDVLIDEVNDNGSLGRTYFQAEDVDGLTMFEEQLTVGSFVRARIVDATDYDLIAEVI